MLRLEVYDFEAKEEFNKDVLKSVIFAANYTLGLEHGCRIHIINTSPLKIDLKLFKYIKDKQYCNLKVYVDEYNKVQEWSKIYDSDQ